MALKLEWKRQNNQKNTVGAEVKTAKRTYRAEISFGRRDRWEWELREKLGLSDPETTPHRVEGAAGTLEQAAQQAEEQMELIVRQIADEILAHEEAEEEIVRFIRDRKE